MTKAQSSKAGNKSSSFYSKAFKQGISSLMDEIRLAVRWSRPSILVAVHQGSAGQEKARARLKKEIEAIGKKVRSIQANTENLNVIQSILSSPEREKTIFFVIGIGRMDEIERRNIYRALNFQREMLVENRIILVLWLASTEAVELPHLSPDFWAFRHRVVEFAPDRGAAEKASR